jgi:hypothetical protein
MEDLKSLHDAELVSIEIIAREIRLTLLTLERLRRVITLGGVRGFAARDLWEQNVCLDIDICPLAQADENAVRDALHIPTQSHSTRLDEVRRQQGLNFFRLVPSVGADIVAVCASISIQP